MAAASVTLFAAYAANYYLQRDFIYGSEVLSKADFEYPANYTLHSVPTTYYCTSDQLDNLLINWDYSPIHLYRASPNCPQQEVELNKLKTDVRARRVVKECRNESTICAHRSCVPPKEDVHVIDIQEVLSDPGWYVNFDGELAMNLCLIDPKLKFDSISAYMSAEAFAVLNRMLPISLLRQHFMVLHGFISNFKESVITAVMHANHMSSSLAVQYVGSKTWLFIPREIYLSNSGFSATPTVTFAVPRRAPRGAFGIYEYTSIPGDLLFFQESYAHIVFTHAGPNILVNYRMPNIGNFFRQPMMFLHGLLERALYIDKAEHNKVKPSPLLLEYMTMQNNILCKDSISKLDQDLLNLILKTADAAKP